MRDMKAISQKYFEGRATEAEQVELLKWLRQKENMSAFRICRSEWEAGLKGEGMQPENQEAWYRIQDRLFSNSYEGWNRKVRIFSAFKYAALVIFMVSLGTVIFMISGKKTTIAEVETTVVADNGQISKIILPDSSIVWLNSGTTLSYSNLYSFDNRNLKLNGEAWFQVRKNKNVPMVVNCAGLFVKVTGTSFNISAYQEYGKIDVVLETGAVEIYEYPEGDPVCRLMPGELAEFTRTNRKMEVSKVNTAKYRSWKEGMVNFYNLRLEEIVFRLEKRYNQRFLIDEKIKAIPLTFTIKNESLESVLNLMSRIAPVSAVQKEELIYLNFDKNKAIRMEKRPIK